MILGSYYLTIDRDGALGEGKIFKDDTEALLAYDAGEVHLQAKVLIRQPDGSRLETTVGRVIFNSVIPKEVGYINETVGKKGLGKYELLPVLPLTTAHGLPSGRHRSRRCTPSESVRKTCRLFWTVCYRGRTRTENAPVWVTKRNGDRVV